jgi:large subunit ribosomal protein L15
MLNLHSLQKSIGSNHNPKRVGRGDGSGKGTYSTRGMKGQRSRAGGRAGLATRSIKEYLLRIPKNRGFRSLQPKMAVVNVEDLEKNFNNGDTINARALLKAGLIETINDGLKVLSLGKLSKSFTVEANAFSKDAEDKIVKAGGKIMIVKESKIAEARQASAEAKKQVGAGEEVK